MADTSQEFTQTGLRPKFPKAKAYLKSYSLGPANWESEDLPRLRRYADTGSFGFRYAPGLSENTYNAWTAATDLAGLASAKRWKAVQGALSGSSDWMSDWHAATACEYWHLRLNCAGQAVALDQFSKGQRPQLIPFLFLHTMGANIGICLSLGWTDWALELTRCVLWGIENKCFNDADDLHHRRTQYFILRLVQSWQAKPEPEFPACAYDEPLFNALVANWRTDDLSALPRLLVAACDRHTFEALPDTGKGFHDLPWPGLEYVPFEVLAVLRLRELCGLPNPDLSTSGHPLLSTPLGVLPAASRPYSDPVIDGVLARARQELPGL
jgi:hypothetical protein